MVQVGSPYASCQGEPVVATAFVTPLVEHAVSGWTNRRSELCVFNVTSPLHSIDPGRQPAARQFSMSVNASSRQLPVTSVTKCPRESGRRGCCAWKVQSAFHFPTA